MTLLNVLVPAAVGTDIAVMLPHVEYSVSKMATAWGPIAFLGSSRDHLPAEVDDPNVTGYLFQCDAVPRV